MVNHRRALMMLVLLLITSFSPALMPDNEQDSIENLELDETNFSEKQRLELATMNWHKADSMSFNGVEISSYSGLVHLSSGSFDPLSSSGPKVVERYYDELDYQKTGFAILQLEIGSSLEKLQEKHDSTVQVISSLRFDQSCHRRYQSQMERPLRGCSCAESTVEKVSPYLTAEGATKREDTLSER